ncbi:MAG: hypothetical protein KGY45_00340 [Hadesarchaea archaeon]|nr:hypothetical protein [Hadesarchaea archaeon]
MSEIKEGLKNLLITSIASVLLVVLGIIYFGITLWIIKIASKTFFGTGLEANWAVLSAAILATGAIIASTLEKKGNKENNEETF